MFKEWLGLPSTGSKGFEHTSAGLLYKIANVAPHSIYISIRRNLTFILVGSCDSGASVPGQPPDQLGVS